MDFLLNVARNGRTLRGFCAEAALNTGIRSGPRG
jgi:hypothetical protein